MPKQLYTGFHAVEEKIRSVSELKEKVSSMEVFYAKPGPRVKKIIEEAKRAGIVCSPCASETLDKMVQSLPLDAHARNHRGVVLQMEEDYSDNAVYFDGWIAKIDRSDDARLTVVVLDSVTDPHNMGAILRSADQFGASLVIVPERRSVGDVRSNDVVARSSAGASAWVPVVAVKNLVRSVQLLKEAGFWIYGADSSGVPVQKLNFAAKTALVMGSEGKGISRLLADQCDALVSIPTCGRIDSLNVSVAAGVLLYEIYRQRL
ncbi:23S rRNA (guanosine(2251)-2'-O)-methyltransferase RlmB [Treponema parvum]|uniref:23S rRNA (Guanosine(2251)-2'-O)-methyltransferase RlmB n=1 Tax=Treponema parvum TaxID=138851 RepID=A0A975IFD7_9SPIR|nr:23S rRNA (guanosine(2251)-2'-O)-methyltransferase RlmB [Treponema parvum]QTQ14818.1 23S rRNA (guanosine(2251)-2'-O)-methyltransferase RlmB [Treponema parvum]